jgi:hypothetical protein
MFKFREGGCTEAVLMRNLLVIGVGIDKEVSLLWEEPGYRFQFKTENFVVKQLGKLTISI